MGSTGKGFRYPQYSDTPDIPRDLSYLADDVDAYLDAHPGPQGTTGSQGTLGAQGTTGTQGAIGTQGATGAQGTVGAQGTTGSQGTTGTQGTLGTQGTDGVQGTTGAQGTIGTGTQGTQGTLGTQGIQGTVGQTGAGGGTWSVIGTYTASTGFFSSFTGLNGAYKELILIWQAANCTSANGLLGNSPRFWVNSTSSGFTGANDYANSSSAGYMINTSSGIEPNLTFRYSSGKLHIRNADSTGTKQWDMVMSGSLTSAWTASTSFQTFQGGGTITQASAINTINFQVVSETWTSGLFTLWGLA
jgi:hypothetical protein